MPDDTIPEDIIGEVPCPFCGAKVWIKIVQCEQMIKETDRIERQFKYHQDFKPFYESDDPLPQHETKISSIKPFKKEGIKGDEPYDFEEEMSLFEE